MNASDFYMLVSAILASRLVPEKVAAWLALFFMVIGYLAKSVNA